MHQDKRQAIPGTVNLRVVATVADVMADHGPAHANGRGDAKCRDGVKDEGRGDTGAGKTCRHNGT